MQPRSPSEAKALGARHYFTGNPCKRGHVALRFTTNKTCTECLDEDRTRWERENADKKTAMRRRWVAANPDKVKAQMRRVYEKDPAKRKSYREKAFAADPHGVRAQRRAQQKAWYAANPGALAFHSAKRRAALQRATPAWADLDAIRDYYDEAARKGLQVDHIIPLRGKGVCGLHVQNNLQLLTQPENASKGNRYET